MAISSAAAPATFSPHVDAVLLDRLAARVITSEARERAAVELPFTGEPLGSVPLCTPADVLAAARRARDAQTSWARVSPRSRAAVLLKYHDLLIERREEILDLLQLEGGKARRDAFEEVAHAALVARYYGNAAPRLLGRARRGGAFPPMTAAWEYRHPVGLAGFIVPWNYPLTLGISDALPALAAGNAVLIKPDLQTPYSALWAAALLEDAGLPPGLVQIVTGRGDVLGPHLIAQVNFLMFTGSTTTGRIVARQAAEQLIGCSLELGGKNAMLVLDDANINRAVHGAITGCFSNAGQLCISMERLYVHERIYELFVPRFVQGTRALKLGAALTHAGATMGSLVSRQQLARVMRHVQDAVAKGARVLVGGRPRPDLGPYFYEPTILENVSEGMLVCSDETFGPVVSLYRFGTEAEALAQANASPYGLNFSVWSRDVRRARRLATRLQAGSVNINEAYGAAFGSVDAPMGGFKHSGVGRRHGAEGILKYTQAQTVAVQRLLPIAAPPAVSQATYAAAVVLALKLLRRLPGIR